MNIPIVHISDAEIVFARFREKGKALLCLEASRYPLDKENPLAALRSKIVSQGREDEKSVLSISPALLFMREIEIPIKDRRKIRELLPLELKGETAIDTEELVFEALHLDKGKTLAVWCKRKELTEKIRAMADQGLEPRIVSASLFYWADLLSEEDKAGTIALSDGEALAVFRKELPLFFRPLMREQFVAGVEQALITLEMAQGVRIDRVFLHGWAARQPNLSTFSGKSSPISFLPLPVSPDLASAVAAGPMAPLDLAGLYALARGLSRKEPIDLRRGDLAYTADGDRTRKKLRFSIILAGVLALLLLSEAGLRYFLVKNDLASLNQSVGLIYREIFPSRQKPMDEVAETRSEIKRLGSAEATASVLPALRTLAQLKGDEILGIYEAEVEGNQVRVKGDARPIQGVNDFKTRAAAVFDNADVGEIKSRPDGSVSFVFKAVVKEGQ